LECYHEGRVVGCWPGWLLRLATGLVGWLLVGWLLVGWLLAGWAAGKVG